MTTVKQAGTTVEIAIEKALQQLNVSRDDVEIDILTRGRKGFLGIGAKEAEIRVTVKEKNEPIAKPLPIQQKTIEKEPDVQLTEKKLEPDVALQENKDPIVETTNYLINVAKEMQVNDVKVSHEMDGKYVYFQLESDKAALLIGKRGQTLNALQQLAQLVANQYAKQFKVVRLNVGDYRERREQSLAQLADRMADKAVSTGRKVQLEPMPAYERKVIHHTLSTRMDIETHSEGKDPYRYLVIMPI